MDARFLLLTILLSACADDPAPAGEPDDGLMGADLPPAGPYGTRTLDVEAAANWVNTGLYLRAGESAVITATGTWSVDGNEVGPDGGTNAARERGCKVGSLVARSGLRYAEAITCIGDGETFVAPSDDIVYVGMIYSTDLGETYGSRLALDGAVQVTVDSQGDTVPTVPMAALEDYDFAAVASGWVELQGTHNLVTIPAEQAAVDRAEAVAGLQTLDRIYEIEAAMRGMEPFGGRLVRWYPDPVVSEFAYMLAGNPMRCDPSLMTGNPGQRILRAAEEGTDIWGFAHELGHAFTMPNGFWVYMYVNLESWPNLFTLHALQQLGRTADQPNYASYCDGRDAYLASPDYEGQLRDDPFLQLCFLTDIEDTYGPGVTEAFFQGLNEQVNEDVGYDGTDASVWAYVKGRYDLAAGTDTRGVFDAWGVPWQ